MKTDARLIKDVRLIRDRDGTLTFGAICSMQVSLTATRMHTLLVVVVEQHDIAIMLTVYHSLVTRL